MDYLNPLGVEGLSSANVLRLAERLGSSVLRKASLICQTGEGGWQSGQESDEGVGVHGEWCREWLLIND